MMGEDGIASLTSGDSLVHLPCSTVTDADLIAALHICVIPPYPGLDVSVPLLILALAVFHLCLILFAKWIIVLLEQFPTSLA